MYQQDLNPTLLQHDIETDYLLHVLILVYAVCSVVQKIRGLPTRNNKIASNAWSS